MSDSYNVNDTIYALISADNDGGSVLDDYLVITIENSVGKILYWEEIPIYLEANEGDFIEFVWEIPPDMENSNYLLWVEFDNDEDIGDGNMFSVE